jgi:hypothetical protein
MCLNIFICHFFSLPPLLCVLVPLFFNSNLCVLEGRNGATLLLHDAICIGVIRHGWSDPPRLVPPLGPNPLWLRKLSESLRSEFECQTRGWNTPILLAFIFPRYENHFILINWCVRSWELSSAYNSAWAFECAVYTFSRQIRWLFRFKQLILFQQKAPSPYGSSPSPVGPTCAAL